MLLVSNVDSKLSAAALDIKVGSFYDPVYLQGLCHLCEHVLFTGSENILTTAMAVFFLSVEEVQMHLHHRNTPIFILIFLQNIFVKLFKDLYLFLHIPFSAKQVSKMNWKVYRVSMRKIGIMMFGGQTR